MSDQSDQTENPTGDEDQGLEKLKKQLADKLNSATDTNEMDEKNKQEIQDAEKKIEKLKTELESKKSELNEIVSKINDDELKKHISNGNLSQIEDTEISNLIITIRSLENGIEKQKKIIGFKNVEIESRKKSYWQPNPKKTRKTSRQKKTRNPVDNINKKRQKKTMKKINKKKQEQKEIERIKQKIGNAEQKKLAAKLQKQRQEQLKRVKKSTKKKKGSEQKYSIYHQYTF